MTCFLCSTATPCLLQPNSRCHTVLSIVRKPHTYTNRKAGLYKFSGARVALRGARCHAARLSSRAPLSCAALRALALSAAAAASVGVAVTGVGDAATRALLPSPRPPIDVVAIDVDANGIAGVGVPNGCRSALASASLPPRITA
jgi:hypothetical protein